MIYKTGRAKAATSGTASVHLHQKHVFHFGLRPTDHFLGAKSIEITHTLYVNFFGQSRFPRFDRLDFTFCRIMDFVEIRDINIV